MPYYEMFPQGIPASLKTEMNTVLNKKFGTTGQDYPTEDWPEDVNLLGLLEIKTASSASVCAFDDGADDVPTKSVKVTIPASLSGVSSVTETQTGKNIYNKNAGVYDDDYFNQDGTTSHYGDVAVSWIRVKPNTKYTFSLGATPSRMTYLRWINCDKDKNFISRPVASYGSSQFPVTVTTPNDCQWVQLAINEYPAAQVSSNDWIIQIEENSSATAYEAYNGTTYTASLGRTIYGGEVDIVNGTGQTQYDVTALDDKLYSYISDIARFNVAITGIDTSGYKDNIIIPTGYTISHLLIQNAINAPDMTMCVYNGSLYVKNLSCTSRAELQSALSGENLVFPLATPTDFTFTGQEVPTRLGYNAFWSDEGDTEVTYRSSGTETIITPVLVTKTITENGTYNAADDSADGYSSVTVNIPSVPSGSHEDPLNGLSAVKYNTGMVFSGFYIDNGILKTELAFESRAATGYEGFQIDLSNYNLVPGTNYEITFVLYVPNDISFNGSYPWGIKYSSTAITNPAGSSFNITPDVDFLEQTGTQSVTMQFTASSNNYLLVLFSRYANGTLGKVTILRNINISEVTP